MPVRATTYKSVHSLRQQVYDYLRQEMNRGHLYPGIFLDLNAISAELGISRTPLREALLQLETEGFVITYPRKGVMVAPLTLDKIRNIYQILGALEAAAIAEVIHEIPVASLHKMANHNERMRTALADNDFDLFHEHNIAFHDTYLSLSSNTDMYQSVNLLKQRLYDFPRKKGFVKEWEIASTGEHATLLHFLEQRDLQGATRQIRDIHWSFQVQEQYIQKYYFASLEELDKKKQEAIYDRG
ncbi:MAG: GntR family transcriptional regulator [Synergistales bacterium]|nr:GntR family transcriptional regulator [Synergistales bacterium]